MTETVATTGLDASHYIAAAIRGYGVTHVFFVPYVLTPALAATGDIGIIPVSTHSEIAAAYMADGYARAARLGIGVVVVVNNNGGLSQTRKGFEAALGPERSDRGRSMWQYRETSFTAIAESFGCLGLRVQHAAELRPALERALSGRRPAVVDVVADVDALPLGPWE